MATKLQPQDIDTTQNFIFGSVGIGATTARTINGTVPTLQVEGTTPAAARPSITLNSNSGAGAELLIARSRGTSLGSSTILQNGDYIGGLSWNGANGVDMSAQGAYIFAQISGTPSSTSMPSSLIFATTPTGSVGASTALTLDNSQNATFAGNIIFSPTTKGIQGTTTNDSVPAGFVGEWINSSVAQGSATTLTSGQYKDITTITLSAGDWDISCLIALTGGAITGTIFYGGIGTVTGNNNANLNVGDNASQGPTMSTAVTDVVYSIPASRVTLTGSTTYYLKAYCIFTVGTAKAYGRISARRIR